MTRPSTGKGSPGERRLAAIMFTDVVGSSRLMHRNEELAVRLITRDLAFIENLIARFGGHVLKRMGDGLLATFDSAVSAVGCAENVQRQFAVNAATLPPGEALRHRIGLHLGEVYQRDGNLMGEGINVTARLQAEAPPGGICISQAVYEQVRTRLALKVVHQGTRHIDPEMRIYQLALEAGGNLPEVTETAPAVADGGATRRWVMGAILVLAAFGAVRHFQKERAQERAPTAANAVIDGDSDEEGADEEPGQPVALSAWFARHDRNGNRLLSPDEIPVAQRPLLMSFDDNGDGALSRTEFVWGMRKTLLFSSPLWPQNLIRAYDNDGDGVLTRDELAEAGNDELLAADANRDGKLTVEELSAWRAEQRRKPRPN